MSLITPVHTATTASLARTTRQTGVFLYLSVARLIPATSHLEAWRIIFMSDLLTALFILLVGGIAIMLLFWNLLKGIDK